VEQPDAQPLAQTPAQPRHPKAREQGFKPGVSGHPRGGGATFKEAIATAIEELVTDFVAAHGRVPTRAESVQLAGLARAERRLRSPTLNNEDMTKLLNTARRLRRDLGLRVKSAPAAPSPERVKLDDDLLAIHRLQAIRREATAK
jgi:hypothetical protein